MQKPPKLIAIHGLKGSGKDLTAKMLRKYILNSITFAFGDRLKQMCAPAFDLPLEVFYDEKLKEEPTACGLTPRQIMTRMQGPIKAEFGQDFFAQAAVAPWARAVRDQHSLVITDLRFLEERKVCDMLGAVVIHVLRPDIGLYSDFSHSSEQGLIVRTHDIVLDNSSDKLHLHMQVRQVIEKLWGTDALNAYPYVDPTSFEFN